MSDAALRLPKSLEGDPRAARLARDLAAHSEPLWSGSAVRIPAARLDAALATALRSAQRASRIVRGLEAAELALAAEERGLRAADRESGVARGVRVSRLLIMSSDGAERFHRRIEALLRRHGPRLLAVRVATDADGLGALLFGPGRRARLLLLEHKDAVAAALLALADQWSAETPAS